MGLSEFAITNLVRDRNSSGSVKPPALYEKPIFSFRIGRILIGSQRSLGATALARGGGCVNTKLSASLVAEILQEYLSPSLHECICIESGPEHFNRS